MSSQIALPITRGPEADPARIVVGSANAHIAEALAQPDRWPFRTAVLTGPARSGKSLLARWFALSGKGEAADDALPCAEVAEADLFHRWNRAQESGTPLLIVASEGPSAIALPDLRSRLGAALHLEIGLPDDAMAQDLVLAMAEQRGLTLGEEAATYLVPRAERSFAQLEKLVDAVDRLSLERKAPPTLAIWRAALEAVEGPRAPTLL
ncbi:HdaA/DnaA family protein [Altericroceibacterium xinjiangense]|uniref:HdaA/DnaA family protein n=1 Tax=Altericroceibacterium xinjiangense TaxID=762261 RepID=UPI000F7E2105|nr:DnaA/Hda family protein [Altericroceibacterium xinjiangense]